MKNLAAMRANPCLKEQNLLYACLDKNKYDREECNKYFENINTCKKFWGKVVSDRKAKGLHPYMPEVEERDKIKQEYLAQWWANFFNGGPQRFRNSSGGPAL